MKHQKRIYSKYKCDKKLDIYLKGCKDLEYKNKRAKTKYRYIHKAMSQIKIPIYNETNNLNIFKPKNKLDVKKNLIKMLVQ